LQRAYDCWDELEKQSGEKLFYRTGLVELGPADGVVIPGVLESATQHQLPIEQLSIAETHQRWPGIAGEPHWQTVIEKNAGFLKVEACVAAHHRMAEQAGATLRFEREVRDWRVDGDGVVVNTDDGAERADRLVLAGGSWSGRILSALNLPLQILRKHLYWYDADQVGFELDEGFPCFFHETETGFYYGFPSIDRSGVKVARHSGGQPIDLPEKKDDRDPEDQTLVEDYVRRYLPGVSNRLLAHAACFYTTTPDEHFIVDVHPEHPQVTIVAGLSGHGFKFTSVLGEIASQLAMSRKAKHDIDLFKIDRFAEMKE
jgi:monomeric sarcosine oxidase